MAKILVVDDDVYIRELYEEILKSEGFTTEGVGDGQKALEMLQKGGYDLVLLDIMMPKIDGFGIMDALNANPPSTPNGSIILLTNLDQERLVSEGLKKGAKALLIKADITPQDLVNQVKKHIKVPTN